MGIKYIIDEIKNTPGVGFLGTCYCFIDLRKMKYITFINYLLYTQCSHRACKDIGFEDYIEYTDIQINSELKHGWNRYLTKSCLKELESKDYIFIHYGKSTPKKKGIRYIKLNREKIICMAMTYDDPNQF